MSIFRTVVAKQCPTPTCREFHRRVGGHEGFCKECQQPLEEIWGWDGWRIGLLGLGLAGLGLVAAGLPALFRAALATKPAAPPLTEKVVPKPTPQPTPSIPQAPPGSPAPSSPDRPPAPTVSPREASQRRQQRGRELAAAGRYEAAREEYRRAVESDPTDATAWANLGLADALTGRPEEALASYQKALAIAPDHWLAHYNLGLFWARRGDREKALQHLRAAFAATPDPRRRGDLLRDLRSSAPKELRNDPRFAALLAPSGKETR